VALSFFVSDLHGRIDRYDKLFAAVALERPEGIFIGGDFLPSMGPQARPFEPLHQDFIGNYLTKNFRDLRRRLGNLYPRVFLIMGNDDGRFEEAAVLDAAAQGVWEYIHGRKVAFADFTVYGYAYVPPTPFLLKDWERYDVSRYVDPGSVSPEEGCRSVPVPEDEKRYATIKVDLERLAADDDLGKAIFLFHAPPYETNLDLSGPEGKMIDYVPLDPHLGSIAVRRFIEARQPLLTLHGHIHEAPRVSRSWKDSLGHTTCFSAAHGGPELALVRFDPENLEAASRELI
jgi:Icc-related predicted phosphoesterase